MLPIRAEEAKHSQEEHVDTGQLFKLWYIYVDFS